MWLVQYCGRSVLIATLQAQNIHICIIVLQTNGVWRYRWVSASQHVGITIARGHEREWPFAEHEMKLEFWEQVDKLFSSISETGKAAQNKQKLYSC